MKNNDMPKMIEGVLFIVCFDSFHDKREMFFRH